MSKPICTQRWQPNDLHAQVGGHRALLEVVMYRFEAVLKARGASL
jgi:hypothetical protein